MKRSNRGVSGFSRCWKIMRMYCSIVSSEWKHCMWLSSVCCQLTACSGGNIGVIQKSTWLHAGNLLLQNNPARIAKELQDKAHSAKSALYHRQCGWMQCKRNSLPKLRSRRIVTKTDLMMFCETTTILDCQLMFLFERGLEIYIPKQRHISQVIVDKFPGCLLGFSYTEFPAYKSSRPQSYGTQDELRTLSWGFGATLLLFFCADPRIDSTLRGIASDLTCIVYQTTFSRANHSCRILLSRRHRGIAVRWYMNL